MSRTFRSRPRPSASLIVAGVALGVVATIVSYIGLFQAVSNNVAADGVPFYALGAVVFVVSLVLGLQGLFRLLKTIDRIGGVAYNEKGELISGFPIRVDRVDRKG